MIFVIVSRWLEAAPLCFMPMMLISPSVVDLERLLHICERELEKLDMVINTKKIVLSIRIGPRHDVVCANIVSLNGSVISWTSELRYLGVYIVSSRVFKCSLQLTC